MRESTFTLVYWGFILSFPTKGQLDCSWLFMVSPCVSMFLHFEAREKQLLPLYTSVATTFADLHDRAARMKAKGVIKESISWKDEGSEGLIRLIGEMGTKDLDGFGRLGLGGWNWDGRRLATRSCWKGETEGQSMRYSMCLWGCSYFS